MPSAKHSAWHIIGACLEPSSALISFNSDFFLFRHTAISFLLFVSRAPPPFFSAHISPSLMTPIQSSLAQPCSITVLHIAFIVWSF